METKHKIAPALHDPDRCHAYVVVQRAPGVPPGQLSKYITLDKAGLVSRPMAGPYKFMRLARFTEEDAEFIAAMLRDESSLDTDVMHCHRLPRDPNFPIRWEFRNVDVLSVPPHDHLGFYVTDAYGQKWIVGPGMAEPLDS
jgi:hypothetical protein